MLPQQQDNKTEEKADKYGGKYNAWEEKGEQSRARAESKMKKEAGITCEVVLEKMEEVCRENPTGPFQQSQQTEDKLDAALNDMKHKMEDDDGNEYYSASSRNTSQYFNAEVEQPEMNKFKSEFP